MDAKHIHDIVHALYWSNFTGFEHLAMYALAVYEWLLCLEQEISLVRSPGISPVKVAYLLSRYWPLLTYPVVVWVNVPEHPREVCERIFKAPMLVQVGMLLGASMIMAIRVHAFTGQRLSVAVFLALSVVGIVVFQLWISASQILLAKNGCYPIDIGEAKYLSAYLIAPAVFDGLAVLLIIVHAFRAIPRRLWNASTTTRVFLRDGIGYFLVIFALHSFNAGMSIQPDEAISGIGIPASILLPSILACRIVLNLRSAVEHEGDETLPLTTTLGFDEAKVRGSNSDESPAPADTCGTETNNSRTSSETTCGHGILIIDGEGKSWV